MSDQQDEKYEHHHFDVDPGQDLLRIDKFLMNRLEKVSRNKLQNSIKAGSVLVNGKPVKSNYKVRPLDKISIVLSEPPREFEIVPEDIPVDVIYEDDTLIVINKADGMVVHPGYGNYTGTLVNALTWHFSLPKNPKGDPRPGLVHRIDKDTSGLLVLAKEEYAMTHLAKQFFDHSVERTYQTLVWGNIEENEGTITGFIGRDTKDRKRFRLYDESEDGRKSITHFKVLERFGYVTLVECKLETGRTHQIRVHMKSIGHTIFQDKTYGGERILKGPPHTKYKQYIQNCFKIIGRQALHAKTLGFEHPKTGKRVNFDSQLPNDMAGVLEKWRNYIEPMKLRYKEIFET
ncbi:MAG TPA: RluA family pseudouridine synthase [Bacteroidetes bacterium]|nr:RluA family pseudouridine synthase [Bacteroidota bacterium]